MNGILPCAADRSNVVWMSELEPGRLVPVARGVQRLIAPNPSLMTGPGTNTYLLGEPAVAVIDPGPSDAGHIATLQRVAPRLATIFVTHTHVDHSPGAAALAERTGARLIGRGAPSGEHQDRSFRPAVQPQRDQCFSLSCGALRAIDTPGHASNHVCYLLESEGLLFSGDHILDGVTPVIMPPDGVMADYLQSLRRLAAYGLRAIAPGHGRLLREPYAELERIYAHRLRREVKVRQALRSRGSAQLDELLALVYDDVRPELLPMARCSLEAHLIKLAAAGECRCQGDSWTYAPRA